MKNVKREDNMSKRSLTTVLASAAIAAITASCLNVSVHAATKNPDSPAAVTGGRQLWNGYSVFFQHPPILEFKVAEAAKFKATATFDGKTLELGSFAAPRIDFTPVWGKIPANSIVKVECTALGVAKSSDGREIKESDSRTFMKTAPFRAGSYPPPREGYTRAALRIYDYVFDSPALKAFRETGKPDKSYKKNCYPSKMYSSLILMCERYAAARPERRREVLDFAYLLADYLISIAQPAGTPLEYLPPTYALGFGHPVAKQYAGQTMMHYPAQAGAALAALARYSKGDSPERSAKYLDFAEKIAGTFLRLQGEDGTWYSRLSEATGLPDVMKNTGDVRTRNVKGVDVMRNRAIPLGMIKMFESLHELTGKAEYRKAADKAAAYMERPDGPLSTYNWEGQFEDGPPTPPYMNLTMNFPCGYATWRLARSPGDKAVVKSMRKLLSFIEDQFVVWERPVTADGKYLTKDDCPQLDENWAWRLLTAPEWHVPGVMEQFDCYNPIDCHTAKTAKLYMALYKACGEKEYREKAKALCDSIVNATPDDGNMPTHWMGKYGEKWENWYNCMIETAMTLEELAKDL